jgi:LuxR family transcriptional regulator, maltose regulon positive regulatory protein
MSEPLLLTKFYIPPPRPNIVRRPRLIERLNEGLAKGCKLTLISASAGFGKTTLISEWAAGLGCPVAWLSLDEGDSDPHRFLTYLIAALQTITPGIGKGASAVLQSPQPPPIETILTALINDIIPLSDSFILVLDDYHVIDSRRIDASKSVDQASTDFDAALTFLIEHAPPQLRLVITTREDPRLPLPRLRTRGQLAELRAAELRFTSAEAAEFLNLVMGLNLSDADIAALESRTEGWIAGLQLAALALQGQSMQGKQTLTGFIQSFTGSHRFVLDYLVEEVLQRQTAEVQAFLLRTAILGRLCGQLCDAVLPSPAGTGQKTLEHLEHVNLFIVPLDNERRWYRYHHLFRDLLGQRLGEHCTAEEITALHIRASEWFENNGLMLEAFQHAAAANDVDRAERLMESRVMGLHLRSVTSTILNWLDTLPASVLDARPLLRVRSVSLALMAWRITGLEEKLRAAEAVVAAALERSPLDARARDLSGQIACVRATLALTRYDTQTMLTQSRRALEYLHPENHRFLFTANWAFASANLLLGNRVAAAQACQQALAFSQKSGSMFSRMLATTILGNLQKMDNQLHQAAETYRHVLELAGDNPTPNAGQVHLNLAEIYYEWNDLETAEREGKQSQELMRQYGLLIDRFILAEVFIARLQLARGDVGGAVDRLAEAERSAHQKNFLLRLPDIAAVQVLILIQQGQLAKAEQLARQYELPLSQAQVFIAQQNPPAALALLAPLRQQMEAKGWADELLKVMVLEALALQAQGEKDRAAQVLGEALALAEPGGFVRIFVDQGEAMRSLLRGLVEKQSRDQEHPQSGYAGRLLPAFQQPMTVPKPAKMQQKTEMIEPEVQPAKNRLVEPLSDRELEVLRLLRSELAGPEIARQLIVSPNTFRTHTKNIFSKLGVNNRRAAVRRAEDLDLF